MFKRLKFFIENVMLFNISGNPKMTMETYVKGYTEGYFTEKGLTQATAVKVLIAAYKATQSKYGKLFFLMYGFLHLSVKRVYLWTKLLIQSMVTIMKHQK